MGRGFLRIACVLSISCGLSLAQDEADPFRSDLRADRVQLDLPDAEGRAEWEDRDRGEKSTSVGAGGEDSAEESSSRPTRRSRDREAAKSQPFSFDLDATGILKILLIAVIGALVVLALVVAANALRERRRGTTDVAIAREAHAKSSAEFVLETPSLDEVERLAREGRYTEAIHLLLLRAIASLGKTARAAAQPAATSREILRQVRLQPDPKAALSRLVGEVERCHFGGVEATREGFEFCREAHRVLDETESR